MNCFSTQSLYKICTSTSLQTLVLNGMGSSSNCAPSLLSASNAGALPSCIFSITALEKLYLAGNGLVGDLSEFQLPKIDELSLESNKLTGVVPSFFNGKNISLFGVANNRLGGLLDFYLQPDAASASATYFKASVNRFSWRAQLNSLDRYGEVDVLEGNVIDLSLIHI